MRRLNGMDSLFLEFESPKDRMHHVITFLLGPARPGEGASEPVPVPFADIRAHVERRLDVLDNYRRRIVPTPFGLHHPVWVDNPEFSLDRHLRRWPVRAPGGRAELAEAIVTISEPLLDRRRSLWELWVLQGIEGGRTALVLKAHHCVSDGNANLEIWRALFTRDQDFDRSSFVTEWEEGGWKPEPLPSRAQLVREALADHRRALPGVPDLVRRVRAGRQRADEARETAPVPPVGISGAPASVLNRYLQGELTWAGTSVGLADLKRARTAVPGSTFNDVALTLVSAALRGYYGRRGLLPDDPLVASVPMTAEVYGTGRQRGNKISYFNASLATDTADPVARLRDIHDTTAAGRAHREALGREMFEDLVLWAVPAVVRPFKRLTLWQERGDQVPNPRNNLCVSNLMGPTVPYGVAGAEIEHIWTAGPPFHSSPVNITAMSYVDRVDFTLYADRVAVDDATELVDLIPTALDELLRACDEAPADPPNMARTPAVGVR